MKGGGGVVGEKENGGNVVRIFVVGIAVPTLNVDVVDFGLRGIGCASVTWLGYAIS